MLRQNPEDLQRILISPWRRQKADGILDKPFLIRFIKTEPDNCETPTSLTRGRQNKQTGRELETVLSGRLLILHRLVRIKKQFPSCLKKVS